MASTPFELKGKTVYVAGHRGMVGAALVRRLAAENVELLTATRNEVELRDQAAVNKWFAAERPQVAVVLSGSWQSSGPFHVGQARYHRTLTEDPVFGVESRYDCPGFPELARALVEAGAAARAGEFRIRHH